MNRNEILDRVTSRTTPWDIVVIGGGATGVGCAVDAASRGLDVLLLEQHDFGKGTSSRSTKLVHGGVRYLAQGNISLVREALKERGIMLKNAPHVVHKLAFVVPCYSLWQKIYYGIGLKVYDLLSGKYSFGRSRIISKKETLERLPSIRSDGLVSGVLYFDGQFDDARFLIDLAKTAAAEGAALLNYAKVTSLEKGPSGLIVGVNFTDLETGEEFSCLTRSVINAGGPFCDSVRHLTDENARPILTFSRGTHLVFDRRFSPSDDSVLIPKTQDGRVLFCIPWLGSLLVGTTETEVEHADMEPKASEAEIEFILETVSNYLSPPPARDDILSVFAGIRPLIRSRNVKNTASLSRGHTIEIDDSGLITITGGKWTTYRRMAEDAVDQTITTSGLAHSPSVTEDLAIAAPILSVSPGERLHPDLPYFVSDINRAVRDEMARTVEDVLARRTRALFLNARAAIEMSPRVAKLVAGELGKDQGWIVGQIRQFEQTAKNYSAHVDITAQP